MYVFRSRITPGRGEYGVGWPVLRRVIHSTCPNLLGLDLVVMVWFLVWFVGIDGTFSIVRGSVWRLSCRKLDGFIFLQTRLLLILLVSDVLGILMNRKSLI